MPGRKARREHAARTVEDAAAPARTTVLAVEYDLALRQAVLAEGTPKEDLVRRIVCEWLKAQGYLK